ncbi:substrate-binding domain-containing protein [Bifidobacterium sp. 64T4]|uniref:substrate-binding domain-containing protein n=1 Tax=Bifidobacterium pongonis TaxID=2834432 RepID=UPI001C59399D|nr:substrate-binding domain-containing protein [Bifidobacterium pongonis]MBW3094083.1 substrate-binding domain-containing protein [Bifidobacterium pongonis]
MHHRFGTPLRIAAAIVCAAALIIGTGACGARKPAATKAEQPKVAMLISTLNNPFFVDLRDGAKAEAAKLGVELLISDAQNDSATQQNQAQNAQSQGAKAVIINPVDSDAAAPTVAPLLDAKLPVISVDRAVTGRDVTAHIASDNIAGGAQAADALAEAIDRKGEILILQGIPGAASTRDRGDGFKQRLKNHPDIRVVAEQTANFDRSQALDVTSNLMQAHPNVVGIYAENDEMALGAIQALGSKAGKTVKIFGFDGTADGLKAVNEGTLTGTIAQRPKELGRRAVRAAAEAIKGRNPERAQSIDVLTVTKENVSELGKTGTGGK